MAASATAPSLRRRAPEQLERQRDVREHVPPRQQMRVLEDHADALIGAPHAAALRLIEAGDEPQQRGLAAARGPEQRHEIAAGDREVDSGQRVNLAAGLGPEGAVHAFQRDRLVAAQLRPPREVGRG